MNNPSLTIQQATALRDLLGQCGRRELEALFKKRRGNERVERFQKRLEEVYDMLCVAVKGEPENFPLSRDLDDPIYHTIRCPRCAGRGFLWPEEQ